MSTILGVSRYSMATAARETGVHVATVWRWYLRGVRGRRLTTVMIGGRRYVLAHDLEEFLAAGNARRRRHTDPA